MKIAFTSENLGHALTALAEQLDCRIDLSLLPAAIEQVSGESDLSTLSKEQARDALKKMSVFPDPSQIDDVILSQFDFPDDTQENETKRTVSTKPDPALKLGTNDSVLMKVFSHARELSQLLNQAPYKDQLSKTLELMSKAGDPNLLAFFFTDFLTQSLLGNGTAKATQELKEHLVKTYASAINLGSAENAPLYTAAFDELVALRGSLSADDAISEKALSVSILTTTASKISNIFPGHRLSLVRDPDLPEDAIYLDLISGVGAHEFMQSMLSDQNQRRFILHDNSPYVKKYFELLEKLWGIPISSRVTLIDDDFSSFENGLKEKVGTVRLSNLTYHFGIRSGACCRSAACGAQR